MRFEPQKAEQEAEVNAPQPKRFAGKSGGEHARTPNASRGSRTPDGRDSVWSAHGFSTAFGQGEEFNATGLAEIRLVALESDLARRNQMQAGERGWRRTRMA